MAFDSLNYVLKIEHGSLRSARKKNRFSNRNDNEKPSMLKKSVQIALRPTTGLFTKRTPNPFPPRVPSPSLRLCRRHLSGRECLRRGGGGRSVFTRERSSNVLIRYRRNSARITGHEDDPVVHIIKSLEFLRRGEKRSCGRRARIGKTSIKSAETTLRAGGVGGQETTT